MAVVPLAAVVGAPATQGHEVQGRGRVGYGGQAAQLVLNNKAFLARPATTPITVHLSTDCMWRTWLLGAEKVNRTQLRYLPVRLSRHVHNQDSYRKAVDCTLLSGRPGATFPYAGLALCISRAVSGQPHLYLWLMKMVALRAAFRSLASCAERRSSAGPSRPDQHAWVRAAASPV